MKSKILQWLGIILILQTGLIHYFTSQAQYDKASYMGYVYVAFFLVTIVSAFGIYHKQVWGWGIGLVLSVNSIITFFWSRTLGLPGMPIEDWLTPFGIVAASAEALFVILYLVQPWKAEVTELAPSTNSRLRYILPVAGLFVIASLSAFTYRWDGAVIQAYGHHVGSVAQVCSTPSTSLAELDEKYGVEISLVATSMMNSIVDVRIKIVDPDKAHALLQNQAALLVNQQALILAPHMHSHNSTRLKKGKIFTMFFPTQQIVSKGTQVSLVFGSVRVEPVTVR